MIFLQNSEHHALIGTLASAKGGELTESDRSVLGQVDSRVVSGSYCKFEGKLVGVFRANEELYLLLGQRSLPWSSIESVSIEENPPNNRRLRVLVRGEVLEVDCRREVLNPPLSDLHEPFVEDEDYDFCLFVRNLASDPERRQRVFRRGNA
jgi:hypothetical protein